MADLLTQMDNALGRYYALKGNNDYYNDDNVGKFKEFCQTNGLRDDDEIRGELAVDDAVDCMFIDFDDDFPVKATGNERVKEIFKILTKCLKYRHAYTNDDEKYDALRVTQKDFDLSTADIQKAIETHKMQCPTLFKDGEIQNDKVLLNLIAISHKMGKPYLQYLGDMYQRERVANIKDTAYSIQQWIETNLHCLELWRLDIKIPGSKALVMHYVASALMSYFHRICPALMLTPTNVFVDSLSEVSEWIKATVIFVHSLASTKNKSPCPFQFDAVYAFDKVKEVTESVGLNDENDDDDDNENKAADDVYFDVFGDVKQRLQNNDCPFIDISIDDDEKGGDLRRARLFSDAFKTFTAKCIFQRYKDKKELDDYPRRHRFCAFIDRRKPDDADKKDKNISEKDVLIMFEPPKNCNSFPKDKHVPLFYFDTSRTCVIPNVGYNEGNNEPLRYDGADQKKKLLEQPVTSVSPPSAASILLSFHVESSDEIRCYMYIRGQFMRFMPSDIINLLPLFFDMEFGDNATFATSDRAKKMMGDMKKDLRDVGFNAFFKKYQSKQKKNQ